MVDVTVTSRYRRKQMVGGSGGYSYATSTGGIVPAVIAEPINSPPGDTPPIPYPEPAIFYFTNTDAPSIVNFDTLYVPTYGRHPRFTLIVYEDAFESDSSENELVKYIEPKLTVIDNIITQVDYNLGGLGVVSGYIIINK